MYKNTFFVNNLCMKKNMIIGFIGGFITGLFASGGGLILVPCFMYFLHMNNRMSRATATFCILPWVLISGFFYYKNDFIHWNIGFLCALGGIIGGIIGAKLLKKIPIKYLELLFIIFLAYASIKLIF